MAKVTQLLRTLPDGPLTPAQLAGLDQFHVRGIAATARLAELAGIARPLNILDAGSGFGGPARYLAATFGCTVSGVDLTPSFVAVSRLLNERTGLTELVDTAVGDVLDLPFAENTFDVVWTQHVVMNVRERQRLYREFRRVLKPGGKLAFHDVVASDAPDEPIYPVPWAATSDTSFLLTKGQSIAALTDADLRLEAWNDETGAVLEWFAAQTQTPPPPPSLTLASVVGPRLAEMTRNLARNLREDRVRIVMGVCEASRSAQRGTAP